MDIRLQREITSKDEQSFFYGLSMVKMSLIRGRVRHMLAVSSGSNWVSERTKRRWLWPMGIMATGLAGAAVAVLRGCWHQKMSWPIRVQEHSYQVCLGCGIKRLFDEQYFRSYGPYSYDIQRLIAWDRARHIKYLRETEQKIQRPAS